MKFVFRKEEESDSAQETTLTEKQAILIFSRFFNLPLSYARKIIQDNFKSSNLNDEINLFDFVQMMRAYQNQQ